MISAFLCGSDGQTSSSEIKIPCLSANQALKYKSSKQEIPTCADAVDYVLEGPTDGDQKGLGVRYLAGRYTLDYYKGEFPNSKNPNFPPVCSLKVGPVLKKAMELNQANTGVAPAIGNASFEYPKNFLDGQCGPWEEYEITGVTCDHLSGPDNVLCKTTGKDMKVDGVRIKPNYPVRDWSHRKWLPIGFIEEAYLQVEEELRANQGKLKLDPTLASAVGQANSRLQDLSNQIKNQSSVSKGNSNPTLDPDVFAAHVSKCFATATQIADGNYRTQGGVVGENATTGQLDSDSLRFKADYLCVALKAELTRITYLIWSHILVKAAVFEEEIKDPQSAFTARIGEFIADTEVKCEKETRKKFTECWFSTSCYARHATLCASREKEKFFNQEKQTLFPRLHRY
jgi:hypothetical protein